MTSRTIDLGDGMTSGGEDENNTDNDTDIEEVTSTLAPATSQHYNLVSFPAVFGSIHCNILTTIYLF